MTGNGWKGESRQVRQAWNEVEGSDTEGTESEGMAGLEREVGVVKLGQDRHGDAGTA